MILFLVLLLKRCGQWIKWVDSLTPHCLPTLLLPLSLFFFEYKWVKEGGLYKYSLNICGFRTSAHIGSFLFNNNKRIAHFWTHSLPTRVLYQIQRNLYHDITVHVVPPSIVYDSLMGPSSSSCMYLQCPCLALTIIQKDKRTSSTHFVNKVIGDSFESFFSFFCYVRGNRTLYHNSNLLSHSPISFKLVLRGWIGLR